MKLLRVRAVNEAASEIIGEELFNAYHKPIFLKEIPKVPSWAGIDRFEKMRWLRVGDQVQQMILSGEITVVEEPGR